MLSETVAVASSDQTRIIVRSNGVDRFVRLLQGETVMLGGAFDASAAIAELKLRGFGAAVGRIEAEAFRLSLGPEFVRKSFGDATLRMNGKDVNVSKAGLLLLRRSELTLEETPALDELIALLRLECVVPRDVSALREVMRKVGLEWATQFDYPSAVRVRSPQRAGLADCAVAAPGGDPELADLFELETAVSSLHPLEALLQTASCRAEDWQSVIDVLFRYARAKPSRWRETAHALKGILRKFPESTKCLAVQGKFSVGELLLWLSIDDFHRGSVAGSLDTRRPNFALAWREFHGRGSSPLWSVLTSDDVRGLRSRLFVTGESNFNQLLRIVSAGGDLFEASAFGSPKLSMLAVAAQFGAVSCVRFLLSSGAKVGTAEVKAAFRGGNVELTRLLWSAFPTANPLELALEAVKSWIVAGLRGFLAHQVSELSYGDLVRLFRMASSCGSYSCTCSVLGFRALAASHLRMLHPLGQVGSVLRGGLTSLKACRETSLLPRDSMATEYSEQLREWLPEATRVRLVAKHEGRGAASVNAYIDAAKGRVGTLTFVETEKGGSICGGYLDVAWIEGCDVYDQDERSFIFTLKNHLGVPPTKFAYARDGRAASTKRGEWVYFGQCEGFIVWKTDCMLDNGCTYEAASQGPALFCGDGRGVFRAARWELWEAD
jgi:hypothetical protein